jgi:hypothetical protein
MKNNTHVALKIFATLLPAIILITDWGWVSGNRIAGWAFVVIWGLLIWNAWGIGE